MMDQDELVRVFVKESQVHLESVESDLFELKNNIGTIDLDVLNSIFRGIHSIKGASGFYQFKKIGELSLNMEKLLSQLRYGKMKPNSGIIEALLAGMTALKLMVGDVGKSDAFDIQNEMALLTKYLKPENGSSKMVRVQEEYCRGKQAKAFEIPEEKLEVFVKNGQTLYTLTLFLKKDLTQKGKTPFDLINSINKKGEFIESSLDIDNIEGLADCLENDLSFVVFFATGLAKEKIPGAFGILKDNICMIDMVKLQHKYAPQKSGSQTDTLFLMPKTDLVASQIEALRDSFLKKLKANSGVSKVVFKADHIEIVDSLGVNLIIGIYRQVTAESKIFEITGAGKNFLKVANFFQFPALFNINHEEQIK